MWPGAVQCAAGLAGSGSLRCQTTSVSRAGSVVVLTWHGGGHAALKQLEGVVSDHLGGFPLAAVCAGRHHAGLEQDALEHHLHTWAL